MNRKITLAVAALLATSTLAFAAGETIALQDVTPEMFVNTAASSNAFEIRSSELALDKGGKAEVTAFAQQMIDDHTKAGDALKAAAGDAAVPAEMDPRHQEMVKQLEGAEGDDFDRIYTEMQAAAHAEAVALFSAYSQHGTDEALKSFAAETLPTLETHRSHVEEIVAME